MTSSANSSWIPSASDLILVLPRLAQRAGSFAMHLPDSMDNIAGKIWNGGSIIADATAGTSETLDYTITNTSARAFVQSTAAAALGASTAAGTWREIASDDSTSVFGLIVQGIGRLKNFGGIFSYLTSKWALATFAAAIILNRTQFYASSREHLRLRWHVRLALYILPILAFGNQMLFVLQALRCQTSPDFAQLRYGDPLKHLAIDFAADGGFLYQLSSTLLWWQSDAECCAARNMSLTALDGDKSELRGSMSLLFWFFLTLCSSQFFETLTCALQGRQPQPETGMTIFEHSLAFAECEAMISSALGFGLLGLSKLDAGGESTGQLLSRSEILQRLNVPPEVLLVCLISCFSHISSATLAITGLRDKVRLVNTAIWACCYMSAFVWSFTKVLYRPAENAHDLGVLRFPTVCIVGFIPHLLILIGTIICGTIYVFALLITALSVPPEVVGSGMSFRQRLRWAYDNLQANVQFSQASAIRIKMSEDFYTTLLKLGFSVLTAASEAVYLNEGSRIHVADMTWLERKRLGELTASLEGRQQRKRTTIEVPAELLGEDIARGLEFVDSQNAATGHSPYARERKSKARGGMRAENGGAGNELETGLGLTQRRSRMQLTFDFMAGIFWLFLGMQASLLLRSLERVGVQWRPAWVVKAAGASQQQEPQKVVRTQKEERRDFWMVGPHGQLMMAPNDEVDVEVETRRRLQRAGNYVNEETLTEQLYDWWRGGGWFGTADNSGEYAQPSELDNEDTTSTISMSTNNTSESGWESDDDGRRTPTQEEFNAAEDGSLDISTLSRLLNPKDATEREEARLLSYSLQSSRPMTRSQYRRLNDRSRAALLLPTHTPSHQQHTESEEEFDLESFILSRRHSNPQPVGRDWASGAEGMGSSGPQCVVCQSVPRTVLVWPCGCLSMCDECRVGLAARNYTKCICCRGEVRAFSRLYVP